MADVPSEAPHKVAGKGIKKIPKWAWPIIIGVVVIGALWYRHQQNAAAAAAAANSQNATDPNATDGTGTDSTGYDPSQGDYYGMGTGGTLPSGAGNFTYPSTPSPITITTGGGAPNRPNVHLTKELNALERQLERFEKSERRRDRKLQRELDRERHRHHRHRGGGGGGHHHRRNDKVGGGRTHRQH